MSARARVTANGVRGGGRECQRREPWKRHWGQTSTFDNRSEPQVRGPWGQVTVLNVRPHREPSRHGRQIAPRHLRVTAKARAAFAGGNLSSLSSLPGHWPGRALTLGQFLDHIPAILDPFELRLRSRPGGVDARAADVEKKEEGVKHGLHRWQQGYRLKELITECGHLHLCVFQELGRIGASHSELEPATLLEAHGQDKRKLARFDAAGLIAELCEGNQPLAHERNLFLKTEGPLCLAVEGDAEKVRRLAKNLLVNALKYTEDGGVTVSWGEDKENWWLMVKDTGPGMLSGSSQSLKSGLQEATASAKESDEKSAAIQGEASNVLAAPGDAALRNRPAHNQPGEGIGLSVVKRLCELLDASLEIASSAQTGTTFRVVVPFRYGSPP